MSKQTRLFAFLAVLVIIAPLSACAPKKAVDVPSTPVGAPAAGNAPADPTAVSRTKPGAVAAP